MRILADTSDTRRDFLKLFPWQAEQKSRRTRRHPRDDPREDVGAMSVSVSVSAPWNASLKPVFHDADTDTDILARILADTSDTRDFLKLFP